MTEISNITDVRREDSAIGTDDVVAVYADLTTDDPGEFGTGVEVALAKGGSTGYAHSHHFGPGETSMSVRVGTGISVGSWQPGDPIELVLRERSSPHEFERVDTVDLTGRVARLFDVEPSPGPSGGDSSGVTGGLTGGGSDGDDSAPPEEDNTAESDGGDSSGPMTSLPDGVTARQLMALLGLGAVAVGVRG